MLVAAGPAAANFDDSGSHRVGDLVIDLAIVPTSFVLGHTPEQTGEGLHGGPPPSRYSHHLIVAVFEARGGKRVTDAAVTAVISGGRHSIERVQLEPMIFGGAAAYGAFAIMPPRGNYRITITVQRSDDERPVRTDFWHRHWQP